MRKNRSHKYDTISLENYEMFFYYEHLPEHLRIIGKEFKQLAEFIVANTYSNEHQIISLRKLLEAKDAAFFAVLPR